MLRLATLVLLFTAGAVRAQDSPPPPPPAIPSAAAPPEIVASGAGPAAGAPPASPISPPALAPPPPPPAPPPPAPVANLPRVSLKTSLGAITIALEKDKAPLTVANFLRYVDQKRFDGISFYRALNFPQPMPVGLVQAGVRGRSDKVLPAVKHEPTSQTGLAHVDGAVSMARAAPGTAQGDFFVIVGTGLGALDASAKDPGYAVFGHVVEGMDVVRKILAAPTSPTAGEGAMKGQMILAPIAVTTARRVR